MRLFVSLHPEPALAARLGEAQRLARMSLVRYERGIRWVRPEGMHLTLVFLGEVEAALLPTVQEALESFRGSTGPLELRIGGWGCFPNPRRPSVLWVGIDDAAGSLARLQAGVAAALSGVIPPTEKRAFVPHLTLARVRPGYGGPRLGRALAALPPGSPLPWNPRAFFLMESRPGPSGAEHFPLRQYSL